MRVEPLSVFASCFRGSCQDRARWCYFTKSGRLRAVCEKHKPRP